MAESSRDTEFTQWFAHRQGAMLRTAYLLTGGDRASAEDLLQNTMAKVYLSWDRVAHRGALDAYARKVMLNEQRAVWRRPVRRREVVTDRLPDTLAAADLPDDGSGAGLWTFVATLPKRQRAVIVLRYYEQLSEAEIAEALGCSVGTVKSQASRALASLRARAPHSLNPREEDR